MANSSLFKTHEKQKANTVYIGPNFRGKIVAQKKKEDKKRTYTGRRNWKINN